MMNDPTNISGINGQQMSPLLQQQHPSGSPQVQPGVQQMQGLSSLNQQQQQSNMNNPNQMRTNMFQPNMLQRPPQPQQQQPSQQQSQTPSGGQQALPQQVNAQMLALQRTAAQAMAAAAAAGNNTSNANLMNNAVGQQQIPVSVLQQLNLNNNNPQFQMFVARQLALQQSGQSPQAQQQGTPQFANTKVDSSAMLNLNIPNNVAQNFRPPASNTNNPAMQANNFQNVKKN
ncbi:hypothetical protein G6F56_011348 [Rhizopus delemar]|nr:hypothetical protein G6F56_011348 [Rhizopus delemar]